MTHPHDAYRRPPAAIGVARPWEPADALTLCWAGAVAGAAERRALDAMRAGFAMDGLPWAARVGRPPLLRWAELEEAA